MLIAIRTLIALVCIVVVVAARPTVGWSRLAIMLAALAVLIGMLAAYNKRFR